jgi:hypothetical protein
MSPVVSLVGLIIGALLLGIGLAGLVGAILSPLSVFVGFVLMAGSLILGLIPPGAGKRGA